MLKAVFLDMDETLCDTSKANQIAVQALEQKTQQLIPAIDHRLFAKQYLDGIYRCLTPHYANLLTPIDDEGQFRIALINLILNDLGASKKDLNTAHILQQTFDRTRTQAFDFYPNIPSLLAKIRQKYCTVLITNGPEFSQLLKIETVSMQQHVDHIIIGGQEKEQKPAASIFKKALSLANCEASQAIHIGDSFEADIVGAKHSAIKAVWIAHGKALPQHKYKPDFILQSPLQLEHFFEHDLLTLN